jgi:putative flippase GtrA
MGVNNKKELLRIVKFTLFSISAGGIQLLSFTLLNELVFKSGYWVQYLISVVLSVIWNFTLNREFTFKSASNVPVAMMKTLLFYVVFIPVSTIGGDLLEPYVNEYIILISTMIVNFVGEYLYQRFYVFKNSLETKVVSKEG